MAADSSGAFTCATCHELHDSARVAIGIPVPDHYHRLTPVERERTAILGAETCTVGGHFYIRGQLHIPIKGTQDSLTITAWSSLSEASFVRTGEIWLTPGRESEPPYVGWLSNRIPGYPDTTNLKVRVHTQPVGRRPRLELEPTGHPLSVDYHHGVTADRAAELVEIMLHGLPGSAAGSP